MQLKEYQCRSARTLNHALTREQNILNMIVGIFGEGGEVADIIKKSYFQGHTLDIEHLKEEIGDVMFYICNLANLLDLNMEEIIEGNYKKLSKRYPQGFTADRSINRG